jgi:hypothetical protein
MKTKTMMTALVLAFGVTSAARAQSVNSSGAPGTQQSCENLQKITLGGAKILSASRVGAGEFVAPPDGTSGRPEDPGLAKKLAAFCRVQVVATPSADSAIHIEVWLPEKRWNGKFRGQGNGGFAGQIIYVALEAAALEGYATASTDTGHSGTPVDAQWALGHPERVTDFGYRGIHEMTRIAKAAIEAYYGSKPKYSYFAACSNGGRQGLMEAQRFPEDYDGIVAGAPANYWSRLLTNAVANLQALTAEDGSYVPASKLPALAKAVNAACDSKDGVTDGVLNDPRECRFDPGVMLCKDRDSSDCLTAKQVTTLKALYAGGHDAKGHAIFHGYVPGAEDGQAGWMPWITGVPQADKSLMFAFGTGYFSNMVYEKADWNYKQVGLGEALKTAEEKTGRSLDAADPDLQRFQARGGKLIIYHGWNDPAISALSAVEYYESVAQKVGKPRAEAFTRLYLVPGMQHCGDGPGPNSFGQGIGASADPARNIRLTLEQWVEKGIAPGSIIATKYVNDEPGGAVQITRPLCPYPQVAKYVGSGDTNEAKNFVCATASK